MKKKSVLLAKAIVNSAEIEIGYIPPKAKAFMVMVYAKQIEEIPKGMIGILYIRSRSNGRMYTASVAA